jgi:hypothetical protein
MSAVRYVELTRDVYGMCIVKLNGREVIRDNGDVISHFATPPWLAEFDNASDKITLATALIDACELLDGWVAYKCHPKHKAEHEAHIAKLRRVVVTVLGDEPTKATGQ